MIIVTGAAGFIGSCLATYLFREGYTELVLSDDFSKKEKQGNLWELQECFKIHRDDLAAWMREHHRRIQFVFHLGAKTDTAEFDEEILNRLNTAYSIELFTVCTEYGIPLVYASSAATYGDGFFGFDDKMPEPEKLKPLNPYGDSKHRFDLWVLRQVKVPPFWAGLKFFNVYGPNEYHKGRMASVIFHAYDQILRTGRLKLFRSHRADYADGGQLRDFIFVEDINKVCMFLLQNRKHSGIYNLGTGQARTFMDLSASVFRSMHLPSVVDFIDIPEDIRDKYQYFTEADMQKLRAAGYQGKFFSLEEGVDVYIRHYLREGKHY